MRALSSVALYAFTVALSLRVVSAAITPFLSSSTAKGFLLPCARRNTLRHEEIALETLYNATAGKTWLIRDGWMQRDVDYCQWFGISCIVLDSAGSGVLHVSSIALHSNNLTGSLPSALGSLTQLTTLSLFSNHLKSSIPDSLGALTQLTSLSLFTNQLTGTIPKSLGSLSQLTWLDLDTNHLTGSIPPTLGALTQLTSLFLFKNRLTGTIPAALGSLSQLSSLDLHKNHLSGSLPSALGTLAKLTGLSLYSNQLVGSLPSAFGNLTKLTVLSLYNISLTGQLPSSLGALTQLNVLYLDNNHLTGTVPSSLGNLTQLNVVTLDHNRLSGRIPACMAQLGALSILLLHNNELTGLEPGAMPNSLSVLTLHNNQLQGVAQSFASFSKLNTLTLFGNQLWGTLRLPDEAQDLSTLLVHDNRLSCDVQYNHTAFAYNLLNNNNNNNWTSQVGLLAPGNSFSDGHIPEWAAMANVSFAWVGVDLWTEHATEIVIAIGAVVLLAAGLIFELKNKILSFFKFIPAGHFESLHMLCAQILLAATLISMTVVVPLYVVAANEYQCGKPLLRTTLSYLNSDPQAEWGVAVLACLFAAGSVFIVCVLWSKSDEMQYEPSPAPEEVSVTKSAVVALIWFAVALVFSLPSFMYALSQTIPGSQNTLGISSTVLDAFRYSVGPLVAGINTILVPYSARWIAKNDPNKATSLILVSRFMTSLLVPFTVLYLFGHDCLGGWLRLWGPCKSPYTFELVGRFPAIGNWSDDGATCETGICGHEFLISLVTHADICGEHRPSPGRCSRFVIKGLGELIIAKLTFTAFVCPALTLLFSSSIVRRAQEIAVRSLIRNSAYAATVKSGDTEFAGLVMLMDLALIFGFAVPLVLPLCCISFAGNLAIFHMCKERRGLGLDHEIKPPCRYLLVSLMLGCALNMWFFIDNHDQVAGETLVMVGVPVTVCAGFALGARWHRCKASPLASGCCGQNACASDSPPMPGCPEGLRSFSGYVESNPVAVHSRMVSVTTSAHAIHTHRIELSMKTVPSASTGVCDDGNLSEEDQSDRVRTVPGMSKAQGADCRLGPSIATIEI